MNKFILTNEHLEKRKQKKHFVLRNDIMCTYLQREMAPADYFAFSFQFPEETDKILIDCMPADGEWHTMVLDLSKIATESGSPAATGDDYAAKYLRIDILNCLAGTNDYIDIEFIGLSDNLDDIAVIDVNYKLISQ